MSGFNLDDYVTVAERVEQFYAKFPDGSLQAEVVEMSEKLVVVRAYAYRTAEDARPGIAHSSLIIPGSTPYTKGSELENAETSAVGRAIALLGFGVKKSIASRNELEAKGAKDDTNGGLIGTAVKQRAMTTDFLVRQSPDGPFLGFRLAAGAGAGVICEVRGPLAEALALLEADVIGQRVQVWGSFVQYEPPTVKHAYRAFRVTRIETPTGTIPAEGEPGLPSKTESAEADEPTGADSPKAAPQTVPGMEPDAAGGNVTEPAAIPPAPPAADDTQHLRDGKPIQAEPGPSDSGSAPAAADKPTNGLCGNPSPYGDEAGCELLTGHKGPHKILSNAFPTSWAVPT